MDSTVAQTLQVLVKFAIIRLVSVSKCPSGLASLHLASMRMLTLKDPTALRVCLSWKAWRGLHYRRIHPRAPRKAR